MKLLTAMIGLCVLCCTHGAKYSGKAEMKDSGGLEYMGKFCFQDTTSRANTSVSGVANVDISYTGDYTTGWYLIMYDDQDSSWPEIHGNDKLTCSEKISNEYVRYKEKISFSSKRSHSLSISIFEHLRPRWWWVYMANCDIENNKTLAKSIGDVSFDLHFYQKDVGMWNRESGVNERGLNTMYLFYLCFYVVLFGVQLYAFHVYRVQQYIHQVIKLLTSTIGFELFAVLFSFVDWMIYTETGKHEIFFQIMSEIGYVLANSIFLLLLLVLGQGWTISKFEVSYPKTILITCVLSALFQCGFYIWILVGFEEESTRYYYDTLPMWLYGGLFAFIGLVYVAECVYSFINETLDSKKKLYIALCIFFTLWFLFPLVRIPIADTIQPWSRDVAIDATVLTWNTLTFCVMMLLMWPTWAHNYFNLSMGDTQDRILAGSSSSSSSKSNKYSQLDQSRL